MKISRTSSPGEPSYRRPATSQVANLILAGVGKAGTTSLFWYLAQHRAICPSRTKETRFFLPMSEVDPDAPGVLPPLRVYADFFRDAKDEPYRMEATPHYFHGGPRLISALRQACPEGKIVVTLRDPIARFWSIYRFAQNMLLLPRDVTPMEFVGEAERMWKEGLPQTVEARPYWTSITGSMYAGFVRHWLDAVPPQQMRVIFFEELQAAPATVVQGICEWLEIDSRVAEFDYTVQNRSVRYRSRAFQRLALSVNSERLLRNHRVLKRPLRAAYYRVNGASGDEKMPAAVEERLREIFAQPNAELARLLTGAGYARLPEWTRRESAGPERTKG